MSEKDIIFLIGLIGGAVAGFSIGHLRGQCVGIAWCTKRFLEETRP